MDVCMSGGCRGADVLFGEYAEASGHGVKHFSFQNHRHYSKPEHLVVLNEFELRKADPWLSRAGVLLGRAFPTGKAYTDSLLRRNFPQVRDSERVYATTWLGKDHLPGGGTGWTVTMGILLKIPEVYVHDKRSNHWFKWRSGVDIDDWEFDWKWGWERIAQPPRPHGVYSGIGSHDLQANQAAAIKKLYDQPLP